MTMSHLIQPSGTHALKGLARKYLSGMAQSERDLHNKMRRNKWTWATIPITTKEYWIYGGIDTVITARLYEMMKKKVNQKLYDLEMSAQFALEHMERVGMKIDVPYLQTMSIELADYIKNCEAWAEEHFEINIRSRIQLQNALLQLGWTPTMYTPTGQVSLAKDSLETCEHPLADVYLRMKKAEKLRSTFCEGIQLHTVDGIVHPDIHPLGAKTGRMSMRNPNLQQLPRNKTIRKAFIAREGQSLVFSDYDIMELAVFAQYTQDPGMRKVCESDDAHTETAQLLFGTKDITDEQRHLAKTVTYTILYGAGYRRLAETADISMDEAETLHNKYKELFPGINDLSVYVDNNAVVVDRGFFEIRTRLGRKQQADEPWKLVNHLIQGTCADILKTAIARLWQTSAGEYLRLPIHDELVAEAPDDIVEDVKLEIEKTMREASTDVPRLSASADVYKCWGDKYT